MPTLRDLLSEYAADLTSELNTLLLAVEGDLKPYSTDKLHISRVKTHFFVKDHILKSLLKMLEESDPDYAPFNFRDMVALKFLEDAGNKNSLAETQIERLCTAAYRYADTLIAARNAKPQGNTDASA